MRISRAKIVVPAIGPHETEQPWLTTQADSAQSTGHATSLHLFFSVCDGHDLPPTFAAMLTALNRCLYPVPHVTLHGENAPNGSITQSAGHGASLQRAVINNTGHSLPPKLGEIFTLRRRNLWPDPHVVLQADHVPAAPTAQSIGHVIAPHACIWVSAGHALPPDSALLLTTRVRLLLPVPQVTVQLLHIDKALT